MLKFCVEDGLVITNTWFKQPKRRLNIWSSPDGQHRNQMDDIIINRRWSSVVQSATTLPGTDCGTDHELLVAKLRIKLRKLKNNN